MTPTEAKRIAIRENGMRKCPGGWVVLRADPHTGIVSKAQWHSHRLAQGVLTRCRVCRVADLLNIPQRHAGEANEHGGTFPARVKRMQWSWARTLERDAERGNACQAQ